VISLYTFSHLSCNFSREFSPSKPRRDSHHRRRSRSKSNMGTCHTCTIDEDHYEPIPVHVHSHAKKKLPAHATPPKAKKRIKRKKKKTPPSLVSVSAQLVTGAESSCTEYSGETDSETSTMYPSCFESPEIVEWRNAEILHDREEKFSHEFGDTLSQASIRAFLSAFPNDSNESMRDMLLKAVEWRQGLYPGIFEGHVSRAVIEKVPMCIFETDEFGHPIWYMDLARYQRLKGKSEQSDLETYFCRTLLHIRDVEIHIADKLQRPGSIWTHVAVFNFKGITIWDVKALRSIIVMLLNISNTMFGNMTYKVYFINCGRSFRMISSIFKPFISKETLDNTIIVGSEYLEQLSSLIPLEKIPSTLGGTSKHSWVDGGIVLPHMGYKYSHL